LGTQKVRLVGMRVSSLSSLLLVALSQALCTGAPTEAYIADAISDTIFPVIGTSVGALWLGGGEGEVESARRAVDGMLATGALTCGLKSVIDDDRPKEHHATTGFPSGHTSTAFCVATVLSRREPGARPWAYLWAASVGWSRIELRQHKWYQVLAGAALGYFVGREASEGGGMFGHAIVPDDSPASFLPSGPLAESTMPGLTLIRVTW